MSRNFLIDTDTASDDAVALIMALQQDDISVKAITVVAGNVPLDQGVINALYTVELCGAEVPVYRGAAQPLVRDLTTAQFFHGSDGLGEQHYPMPRRTCEAEDAVDVIIGTVNAHPGITIVTLGPLTNLALAIMRAPEIVSKIERCVIMGGAANTVGNITPAAEYNIWVDPEAAHRVFRSKLPIEMVGCELSTGPANITAEEMEQIREIGTPLANFALDSNRTGIAINQAWLGDPGLALPDPVAMSIAIDPTICTKRSRHHIEVETQSALTRGMTVVDRLGVSSDSNNRPIWGSRVDEPPTTTVCWAIDIPRWKSMLFAALS